MKSHHAPRHLIGGVALINGVLLHAPDAAVMAVRDESGEVHTKHWEVPLQKTPHRLLGLPLIRGFWLLWRMIWWHSRLRQFADVALKEMKTGYEGEETPLTHPSQLPASLFPGLGLIAAFLLYAILILVINALYQLNSAQYALAESTILTLLFTVLFLIYLSRRGGIWSYMGYHGAEHQAIHAYEEGSRTHAAVSQSWPYQTRCGAAVVSYVAFLLIIIGFVWPQISFGWSIVLSLLLFSVAYEIIMWLDHHSHEKWATVLAMPGVVLQLLVARRPSADQSEVAAKALYELTHYSTILKSHSRQQFEDLPII